MSNPYIEISRTKESSYMPHNKERELANYRMERAREELEIAKILFQMKKYLKALNSSYYSIFHATRALLALDKFDSKKHSGIISYFIKNYVKTGKLPVELSKIIVKAEQIRNDSDYKDFYIVSTEIVELQINNAEKFINDIADLINKSIDHQA